MNSEEALVFWNNIRRGMFRRTKTTTIPSRRKSKAGKIVNRLQRDKHSKSMLVAKHPRGMSHVPKYPDDRTRMLISNHIGRMKDKQDRK